MRKRLPIILIWLSALVFCGILLSWMVRRLHRSYNSDMLGNYGDGFTETSPVGSFKANANGIYDLAGNVACWIGEQFPEGHSVFGTILWPDSTCGSSWDTTDGGQLCSNHFGSGPGETRQDNVGFRCVLVLR